MYYPIEGRIHTQVMVRRERLLPRVGTVLARVGQVVAAGDLIGRCHCHPAWHCVDVAKSLRVSSQEAARRLTRFPGDIVERREELAASLGGSGLFRRVCRAPVTGEVSAFHAGRVVIKEQGETTEVKALLTGKVSGVLPGRGVVIETSGPLIRAAWDNGRSSYGAVKVFSNSQDRVLRFEELDGSCHGAVVVAGWCSDFAVLQHLERLGAAGVILGSVPTAIRQGLGRMTIPVFVVDGYGEFPMNQTAYEIFTQHGGSVAALISSGDSYLRRGPEIIIPLGVKEGDEPSPALTPPSHLQVGLRVRLIGFPRIGAVGRIIGMPQMPRRLESGILTQGLDVALDNDETVYVPWMNLEPIM